VFIRTIINITSNNLTLEIKIINPARATLIIDIISIRFSAAVLIISRIIIVYSTTYIKNERIKKRFTSLLLLFVTSMIILLVSPNIFSLIIGWDGLGLSSFCLVIFYQNYYSLRSGLITVLTNRLGDCFLIIAICLIIQNNITQKNNSIMKITRLLIIMAAFTKRAQTPFSAWLPAAIAAPTPVSSLVHSSTLVTAGVYLIRRFNKVLLNKINKEIIMITSLTTSLMAGTTAWKENDAKKNCSNIYVVPARSDSFCVVIWYMKAMFFSYNNPRHI